MTLRPGDVVVRRDVFRGRIWSALPHVVVDDGPDELVAARLPGTPFKIAEGYGGSGFDRLARGFLTGDWVLEDHRWQHTVALARVRPGRWFNLIHFLDGRTQDFLCWYVNFERPAARHPGGGLYDTLDLMLDLVVLPDGSTAWKDADHWDWAIANRIFDDGDVAAVEDVRHAVAADAEAGRPPFDGSWTDWRPDGLIAPALPAGWDDGTPAAP